MIWLMLIPAYFLGTFPSAVMIARSKGVDITKVGSGNPGASNIARTFGTPWGVLVFVLCRAGVAPLVLDGALGDGRSYKLVTVLPGRQPYTAMLTALSSTFGAGAAADLEGQGRDPRALAGAQDRKSVV